jgi:hypothetical protein
MNETGRTQARDLTPGMVFSFKTNGITGNLTVRYIEELPRAKRLVVTTNGLRIKFDGQDYVDGGTK